MFLLPIEREELCMSDRLPRSVTFLCSCKRQHSCPPTFCRQIWEILFLLGFLNFRSSWFNLELKTILVLKRVIYGYWFHWNQGYPRIKPFGYPFEIPNSSTCVTLGIFFKYSFLIFTILFLWPRQEQEFIHFFSLLDKSGKPLLDLTFNYLSLFKYFLSEKTNLLNCRRYSYLSLCACPWGPTGQVRAEDWCQRPCPGPSRLSWLLSPSLWRFLLTSCPRNSVQTCGLVSPFSCYVLCGMMRVNGVSGHNAVVDPVHQMVFLLYS